MPQVLQPRIFILHTENVQDPYIYLTACWAEELTRVYQRPVLRRGLNTYILYIGHSEIVQVIYYNIRNVDEGWYVGIYIQDVA